jgi:hypothetical protein
MLKKNKPVRSHRAAGAGPGVDAEDIGSLESRVVALAMSGQLAKAARRAVRAQKSLGLPLTFKRGEWVIKRHSDGREEVLGRVDRPSYRLPKGVRVIK